MWWSTRPAGEGDTLYHQRADGIFEDVSVKAGVNDPQKYYGFSSALSNANDDNLLDLIVVMTRLRNSSTLIRATGLLKKRISFGVALNENGREQPEWVSYPITWRSSHTNLDECVDDPSNG